MKLADNHAFLSGFMLEKLVAGKSIHGIFSLPSVRALDSVDLPRNFMVVSDSLFHLDSIPAASFLGRFGHRDTRINGGPGLRQNRTFQWLPYLPGKITMVRQMGRDILTGPMSGCWVVSFLLDNSPYVGHIGTDLSANSEQSVQVKKSWNAAMLSGRVKLLSCFNPVGPGLPDAIFKLEPELRKDFYAVVDKSNAYYTLMTGLGKQLIGKDVVRVCSFYRMPPSSNLPF
ncbi:hypothetical protein [Limoniibacter endophyticus]|uniref:Uncharacterized protein n=1 Tax=Limoniibacter endophyticus TaxID=1565040 RepID=A0A8J3GGL2_9HYPH|nr:hypothetical protein [Limoniibacter endophyticus]GHC69362.1 hypothetical protein GCM10010136_15120 [Limoniibacter endophyticus]